MKIAKLPNGKSLKFPPHTPDEAIDQAVRAHLKEHTDKANAEREQKQQGENRHNQLVELLSSLSQIAAYQAELLQRLAKTHADAIQAAGQDITRLEKRLADLDASIRAPRAAVFENGRIVGSKTTH